MKALYEGGKLLELACFSHDLAAYSVCPSPSTPDLRRAINALQFLCLGYPGQPGLASAGERNTVCQQILLPEEDLDVMPEYDVWVEADPSFQHSQEATMSPKSLAKQASSDLQRLWRLSDSSSEIDSSLSRRPAAILEVRFFAHDWEDLH